MSLHNYFTVSRRKRPSSSLCDVSTKRKRADGSLTSDVSLSSKPVTLPIKETSEASPPSLPVTASGTSGCSRPVATSDTSRLTIGAMNTNRSPVDATNRPVTSSDTSTSRSFTHVTTSGTRRPVSSTRPLTSSGASKPVTPSSTVKSLTASSTPSTTRRGPTTSVTPSNTGRAVAANKPDVTVPGRPVSTSSRPLGKASGGKRPTPTGLAEPSSAGQLLLPALYQALAEKFRCTDVVCNMLQRRKEECTFQKLKQSVQEMTRKSFSEADLGKMKTVLPDAFLFSQQKGLDHCHTSKYRLVIAPNSLGWGSDCLQRGGGVLGPAGLVQRRKLFRKALVDIVKGHHSAFLSSLKPPLSMPPDKIHRWHPQFKPDSLPDVEPAELPRPPSDAQVYTSAQQALDAFRKRVSSNKDKSDSTDEGVKPSEDKDKQTPSTSEHVEDPALKGIPQSLIDKIRQKEAAKAQAVMARDPATQKMLEMLERLPGFIRILKNFFISQKGAVLLENVVQKLVDSHTSGLRPDQVERHLYLLVESLPQWIRVMSVQKRKYVKVVDKDKSMSDLMKVLNETERNLKCN